MNDKLNIELEAFTGPFDLLLDLIEKNKIDIYEIALEDITNSYIDEIYKLENLNNLSEFIYIASILLTIKANKLKPKEENDDLEEEFLSYLITYKKIKSVEDDFKEMEESARRIYSKYQEDLSQFETVDQIVIKKDINILKDYFQRLMKDLEKKEDLKILNPQRLEDVNLYIEKIRKTLNFTKSLKLENISQKIKNKSECIATFLALLELVRLREIYLKEGQNNSFYLTKR
ncbi:MAG: segregation/condensation protein A [Anaerococcus sp.]|nr:segregation/condensation protein A [Anaerococcus sp.]